MNVKLALEITSYSTVILALLLVVNTCSETMIQELVKTVQVVVIPVKMLIFVINV